MQYQKRVLFKIFIRESSAIKYALTNAAQICHCWKSGRYFYKTHLAPPPLEKCVGHNLKISDIVKRFWAPLGTLFAPPGVPSWLRACVNCTIFLQERDFLTPWRTGNIIQKNISFIETNQINFCKDLHFTL